MSDRDSLGEDLARTVARLRRIAEVAALPNAKLVANLSGLDRLAKAAQPNPDLQRALAGLQEAMKPATEYFERQRALLERATGLRAAREALGLAVPPGPGPILTRDLPDTPAPEARRLPAGKQVRPQPDPADAEQGLADWLDRHAEALGIGWIQDEADPVAALLALLKNGPAPDDREPLPDSPPSPPPWPRRRRSHAMRDLIRRAFEAHLKHHGTPPSAQELWERLDMYDEDDILVQGPPGPSARALLWTTTRGRRKTLSRKSFENYLSALRAEADAERS